MLAAKSMTRFQERLNRQAKYARNDIKRIDWKDLTPLRSKRKILTEEERVQVLKR